MKIEYSHCCYEGEEDLFMVIISAYISEFHTIILNSIEVQKNDEVCFSKWASKDTLY